MECRAKGSSPADGGLTEAQHCGPAAPSSHAPCHPIDDISSLLDISEQEVGQLLRERYLQGSIYTRIGADITVAVNPFEHPTSADRATALQMYCQSENPQALPPHVFGIASATTRRLLSQRGRHAIVISGESGAGKTETTKLLLAGLLEDVAKSQTTRRLEEMLLHAGDLLEAFGNAATLRNRNSSRFSKWLDLRFEVRNGSLRLSGCNVVPYILETTRVCGPNTGERNFHIFYQLLASGEFQDLGLPVQDAFAFLGASSAHPAESEDFDRTRHALDLFGIDQTMRRAIARILAAILMLGNCQFADLQSEPPVARIVDDLPAMRAADFLGVPFEALNTFLLQKLFVDQHVPVDAATSKARCHGLAQFLYKQLFDLIVGCINRELQPSQGDIDDCALGILDIAGFESFDRNSLEQLLINFSNEHIQQLFNESVVNAENEDLKRELEMAFDDLVQSPDDDKCVRLIEHHMLKVLQDETIQALRMRKEVCDFAFTAKLAKECQGLPRFIASRFAGATTVSIEHYAGRIQYSCEGWVGKNLGRPPAEVHALLGKSSNELLREFGSGVRGISKTHVDGFVVSLKLLIAQLKSSTLQFIRCIKPNSEALPRRFVDTQVRDQLLCNGIIEASRIRKIGYSSRWRFADFASRFSCLIPFPSDKTNDPDMKQLLQQLHEHPMFAQRPEIRMELVVGRTKVLAKHTAAEILEGQRRRIDDACFTCQRAMRRWIQIHKGRSAQQDASQSSADQDLIPHPRLPQQEEEHQPSSIVNLCEAVSACDRGIFDRNGGESATPHELPGAAGAANATSQHAVQVSVQSLVSRFSACATKAARSELSRPAQQRQCGQGSVSARVAMFGEQKTSSRAHHAGSTHQASSEGQITGRTTRLWQPPQATKPEQSASPQKQAFDALLVAKKSPSDVTALRAAIAQAERENIQQKFQIKEAKLMLEREEAKIRAREWIHQAFDDGSCDIVLKALREGRSAKLREEDLIEIGRKYSPLIVDLESCEDIVMLVENAKARIEVERRSVMNIAYSNHVVQPDPFSLRMIPWSTCPICCESSTWLVSCRDACAHSACLDCWTRWAREQLDKCCSQRRMCITCFTVDCDTEISNPLWRALCDRDSDLVGLERRLERRRKLQQNRLYPPAVQVDCPMPLCVGLGYLGNDTIMCFICEHQWGAEGPTHEASDDPLGSLGMKQCPRCGGHIEKNGGCDHMTCRCGYEFWWSTLAPYRL